jgi:hypothetical protein
LTLRPLHRQPSHGLCRVFLSAFGEDDGEGFGVVGHVERVAFQSGFEGIAEPVAGGWVGIDRLDVEFDFVGECLEGK